eukprot:scaffold353_cov185-Amphora_coffeaeformis.AAC.70
MARRTLDFVSGGRARQADASSAPNRKWNSFRNWYGHNIISNNLCLLKSIPTRRSQEWMRIIQSTGSSTREILDPGYLLAALVEMTSVPGLSRTRKRLVWWGRIPM